MAETHFCGGPPFCWRCLGAERDRYKADLSSLRAAVEEMSNRLRREADEAGAATPSSALDRAALEADAMAMRDNADGLLALLDQPKQAPSEGVET